MTWLLALALLGSLPGPDPGVTTPRSACGLIASDCHEVTTLALVAIEQELAPLGKEYGLPQAPNEGEEDERDGDDSKTTIGPLWLPTQLPTGLPPSGVVGSCRRLRGVNPFARPSLLRC